MAIYHKPFQTGCLHFSHIAVKLITLRHRPNIRGYRPTRRETRPIQSTCKHLTTCSANRNVRRNNGIETQTDLYAAARITWHCNNSFIVDAENKSLNTIGIVRYTSCSRTECSNNDILTLIFIALDQLRATHCVASYETDRSGNLI